MTSTHRIDILGSIFILNKHRIFISILVANISHVFEMMTDSSSSNRRHFLENYIVVWLNLLIKEEYVEIGLTHIKALHTNNVKQIF